MQVERNIVVLVDGGPRVPVPPASSAPGVAASEPVVEDQVPPTHIAAQVPVTSASDRLEGPPAGAGAATALPWPPPVAGTCPGWVVPASLTAAVLPPSIPA